MKQGARQTCDFCGGPTDRRVFCSKECSKDFKQLKGLMEKQKRVLAQNADRWAAVSAYQGSLKNPPKAKTLFELYNR